MNRKAYLKNVKTFYQEQYLEMRIQLLYYLKSILFFVFQMIMVTSYIQLIFMFQYPILLCTYVIGVGYLLCTLCMVTIKTITIIHNQTLHSKACIVISFIVIIVILVFTISKENIVILYLFYSFSRIFSSFFMFCCINYGML